MRLAMSPFLVPSRRRERDDWLIVFVNKGFFFALKMASNSNEVDNDLNTSIKSLQIDGKSLGNA